jgi:trimeric autotransporter adhesin
MIISPSAISPYKIPTFQSGGEVPFSFGNALKFDGVNDYTSSSLTKAELGTSFTIGSWLKLDSSVAVSSCIYNIATTPTNPSPFIFVQTTSLGIRFYVNQNFRMSITINRDEWYYIALNYESSNWSVFVNGVSASTYAGGLGVFDATNLYIGGPLVGYSKITIDEFSVWTQELTPTQNLNQYNSGLGNFANLDVEPLLWYNCNEADGSTTLVNSGSGGASYNGTLNNFSTPPAYFIPH